MSFTTSRLYSFENFRRRFAISHLILAAHCLKEVSTKDGQTQNATVILDVDHRELPDRALSSNKSTRSVDVDEDGGVDVQVQVDVEVKVKVISGSTPATCRARSRS
jgi:hypothetical protein